MRGDAFVDPDWGAPLDVAAYVAGIPPTAVVKGVFPAAVAEAARRKGKQLTNARERYHPFSDVPLKEYIPMLVDCSEALFPDLPLRTGLRKLGRASLDAIARSTFGRILLTNILDVQTSLAAVSKGASIATPGSRIEVTDVAERRAVITLSRVYTFIDSHHIGILEKILGAASVQVHARVRLRGPYDGDIELTW
jgi:uncharacterized protein (TIGR02265 family)